MHLNSILLFSCTNHSFTDENGTRKLKQLTVNDVWSLPSSERIVLHWNSIGQPINDSGGLLNRFLGALRRDFNLFPICYASWKKVPYDYKDNVYKNTIQVIVLLFIGTLMFILYFIPFC